MGQLCLARLLLCTSSFAYVSWVLFARLWCLLVPFQGLIDLDVEIGKCEKKLQLAQLNLDKIRKIESQPDYEETVPVNARLANEEKVWSTVTLSSVSLTALHRGKRSRQTWRTSRCRKRCSQS